MSTLLIEATQPQEPAPIEYPDSDGEPMAETETHVLAILHLIEALRHFFRKVPDVYVIGNMFFYYVEGDPTARKSPDVMVVKGVGRHKRRTYKLWEEKVAPCVVFEMTSRGTKNEDTKNKPELYAALGVKEYFLFDPLHEYLEQPSMGYRLVDGAYQPIPANEDGVLFSQELQAILAPEEGILRVVDPRTLSPIPDLDEAVDRAEQEVRRAEREARRAEQEARRADAAEAEAARLRALVEQLQSGRTQ